MSRLQVSLAATLLMVGCGLGEIDEPPAVAPDSGLPSRTDGGTMPKLQKPTIDRPAGKICGSTVGLWGSATPNVTVVAVGGLETSGAIATANPSTGRFCVPVRLKADAANVIEVRAQDPVLGMSEPETVTVTQGTCQTDDVPPPAESKPQNAALGIKPKTSKGAKEGNEGFITDGNATTFATYEDGWGTSDANIWITVKLPKLTELGSIVVKWRSSGPYAAQYKVLTASMSDPGDPNLSNGYWNLVASITAGNGGTDTFDVSKNKPMVQHVAIWLLQDSRSMTWEEQFSIAELEVWDIPKQVTAPPPVTTAACDASGR